MMAAGNPLVLTVEQVADLLQVPASVVGRLRSQRKIAFVKVGGKLRFRLEDVQGYLKKPTQKCQDPEAHLGSGEKRTSITTISTGTTINPSGLNDAAVALMIAEKLKKS